MDRIETDISFPGMIRQARQHWKEHLPKRYEELVRTGTLEESLTMAAEQTWEEMVAQIQEGTDPYEAWMDTRENYLILEAEEIEDEEESMSTKMWKMQKEFIRIANEASRRASDPTYQMELPDDLDD